MLLKCIHLTWVPWSHFRSRIALRGFFLLELGRLKTPRRSLISLANKLDQIAWVLHAWGRCCSEDVKHLGKADSPLCDVCMRLGCEMEEKGIGWHFFGLPEFNNQ